MKKWLNLMLILVLALSIAACGSVNNKEQENNQNNELEQENVTGAQQDDLKTQYPITVKDATGQEFTFDKAPERIVSTSPSETEILFAIGLDEEIVGVSDFDEYPEAAKEKPKMGGVVKPNEEAMMAANADWIVTGVSMKEDVIEQMRGLGLNVFKFDSNHLEDVKNNILLVGQITDRQEEAMKVVEQMDQEIQQVRDAVKDLTEEQKKKVYIEFSPGWTVGKGEFMDELLQIAGGINIAGDMEGWSQISEEKVIEDNPDVILYAEGSMDEQGTTIKDIILDRSGWEAIQAVQDGLIIGLNQDLLTRPGPRLTQGLIEMAKAIYPERFSE
ncbi:ABC transporter substrate-binding protein [Marinicrinis lubricantis]|uniref:ABC transporter substrate-binding protein n=1 Tax=Marinicrinis lubricantis TaxID=2086470 RepID=A0ABW1IQY7_9BACL